MSAATTSGRLSQRTVKAINARDTGCVVCSMPALEEDRWPILQIRAGDDTANGCKVCPGCRAAILRREVGVAGDANTRLSVTDAREEEHG